jgi:tetratricopeptide (TPR) repeat protein
MASVWIRHSILIGCLGWASHAAMGQVGTAGTGGRSTSTPSGPAPGQTIVVSGAVILEGGAPLAEPAAIERLCHGSVTREGYTDAKGKFQIALGQNAAAQGDSDSSSSNDQHGTAGGLPIVVMPPASPSMSKNLDAARRLLTGCQLRAVLPGFQSSEVLLVPEGNSWLLQVGTIVLKRIEKMEGSTVSLTTLSAPAEARREYDKAERELGKENFSSAEKHLAKAVEIFPGFAASWVLLGEIHRRQNQLARAKQDYTEAVRADPQFVNGYFGLAVLAVHEKSWEETVKLTDQITALNASALPLTYLYNSIANFYLGKLEIAEENVRRFESLDPDHHEPYACLLHAQILGSLHDYRHAAEELQTYLRLVPGADNADALRAQLARYQNLQNSQAAR